MKERDKQRSTREVPVTSVQTGQTRIVHMPDTGGAQAESPLPNPNDGGVNESSAQARADIKSGSMSRSASVPRAPEAENGVAVVQVPGSDPAKPDKRKDPQNLADFIAALYSGRMKSLPDAILNKLRVSGPSIEASTRGELLREAQRLDVTLDRTRLLMLLARRAGPHRAIARALREFARDVVKLHPVMQGEPISVGAFPGSSEEKRLDTLWRALYPQNPDGVRKKREDAQSIDGNGGSSVSDKDTVKVGVQLSKARRNAFWCDVLWRFDEDLVGFSDLLRSLRGTVLAVRERPQQFEREFIEALASFSERDEERLALVIEWGAQSVAMQAAKALDLEQRIFELGSRLDTAERASGELSAALSVAERALVEREVAVQEATQKLSILRTHARADFEQLRAKSLGIIRQAVDELGNVDVALSREVPKVEFARDVMQTVIESLLKHIKELEDQK